MLLSVIPKGKAAATVDECPAEGGITALLKASFLGYDETVRQLLKAGANASHADADGAAIHTPRPQP
jgi:ankyrin repeat protein